MPKKNHVVIVGHLGKDPEIKKVTVNGQEQSVCKFSIATDIRKKVGEEWKTVHTDWHSCEVWGSLAELVHEMFEKGKAIHVEGKIRYDEHEGKYYTRIVVDYIAIPLYRKSEQAQKSAPDLPPPSNEDNSDDLPF